MHMEYMGLGEMWDYVLDEYIFPLVSGVYLGYHDVRIPYRKIVGI